MHCYDVIETSGVSVRRKSFPALKFSDANYTPVSWLGFDPFIPATLFRYGLRAAKSQT